ncbi:uncharacterized protein (DUF305 family) [Nocardiopsis mwathae]|uniref:Uncharacterized protein (DUF305 family) n=1 Tax=Nocardiopsis mwathae TaxID=1472723 RepID=A0A7W9YEY7_9ACTN|nr:uncharacterized protein (DUF305 family) [Nocardiopsis mwathae]
MRSWILAAGAAVVLAGAAACSGDGGGSDGPPALDPGAPGDSPTPASEERIAAAAEEVGHNEADVDFLLRMIEHHSQALEMSDLAEDRADNEAITAIADRIAAAQGAEIDVMQGWLEEHVYGPARENPNHRNYCGVDGAKGGDGGGSGAHHGGDVTCPTDLDHSSMPGMATEAQMKELRQAEGAEFDELFAELMIAHHQGGVDMAEDVVIDGKDTTVLKIANDVISEQNAEIKRIRAALAT